MPDYHPALTTNLTLLVAFKHQFAIAGGSFIKEVTFAIKTSQLLWFGQPIFNNETTHQTACFLSVEADYLKFAVLLIEEHWLDNLGIQFLRLHRFKILI